MTFEFTLRNGEPIVVIGGLNGRQFSIGLSVYDVGAAKRLHTLFLMLESRWLGYSAAEFDDEGRPSAIMIQPSGKKGCSLITIEQSGEAHDDAHQLVKKVKIDTVETMTAYQAAFDAFIASLTKKQLKDLNTVYDLALDDYDYLRKHAIIE